ncbi:MAG: hypothetical protein WCW67_01675 [Candidatus Margulisiibacteriota bacterium]
MSPPIINREFIGLKERETMDIGKAFTEAWNIYRKNFWTVFLANLVAVLLSIITLGILFPPLSIGLQSLFIKAKRGEPFVLHDIFGPMGRFWPLTGATAYYFLVILMAILLPCLGVLALLIWPGWATGLAAFLTIVIFFLSFGWMTWYMFTFLYIYDQKMTVGAAMLASKIVVRKNNVWLHLLLFLLSGIISQLGSNVFYVGVLFTAPLGAGALACAYDEETK